ncbi:unnamed protein product [Darwinula stevensoni]|uniref:Uncharacterized protein n=1 Tax=Darwinula stevensoni TaxID=69355 RepID=A0A7R9A8A8_9CRUS|nr:unnamed protein product [Darwinula stevensoni]CAG0896182.1 unnamed protein product [Darwinula stevensoni]
MAYRREARPKRPYFVDRVDGNSRRSGRDLSGRNPEDDSTFVETIDGDFLEALCDERYCNATWDQVSCWAPTPADSVVQQPCPPARGSDYSRHAFRVCLSDGTWMGKGVEDKTRPNGWTNYTACFVPEAKQLLEQLYSGTPEQAQAELDGDPDLEGSFFGSERTDGIGRDRSSERDGRKSEPVSDGKHASKRAPRDSLMKMQIAKASRILEMVGLFVSLITLLFSISIFKYFRKLRNNRTRIHGNLFIAMLIQVLIRLMLYIDQVIVRKDDTGIHSGIKHEMNGIDNTPYVCEVFYILLEYARTAMFMWMFIEGLYLNKLISVAFFQRPQSYKLYYFLGWGLHRCNTAGIILHNTYIKFPIDCNEGDDAEG